VIPFGWFIRDGRPCMTWQHAIELYEPTIRIVGQLCSTNGCTAYATTRTFWPDPDGPQVKCEAHAEHLGRVAVAMGFQLHVEPWWQVTADDPAAPRCPLMGAG
jgi:hypothetical protein